MARRRLLTQAQQEALVKYQPQIDALKDLVAQAQGNYGQKVNSAHAGRLAVQTSIGQVLPQLQSFFDRSSAGADAHAALLEHDTAGLGHVADSIKAAVAAEHAGASSRLGALQTQTLGGLSEAYVRAAQGEQYAQGAAQSQLEGDLTQIAGKLQSVLGQQGAFTAATVENLAQAAAQRAVTRRGQDLSHADRLGDNLLASDSLAERTRHDKAMEKNAGRNHNGGSDAPRLPGGTKLASVEAHNSFKDKIDSALAQAHDRKAKGDDRHTTAVLLATGRPALRGKNSKTGKPSYLPAIPKQNVLAASIAADLAYTGHVSHRNAAELHRRGLSLEKLGLRGRPKPQTPAQTAGSGAGLLATILGLG